MYLGAILDCLNPPCQVGGSIMVNGVTVELAADIQVQGTGDNRILRRISQPNGFYSIYAIPADFIISGATPRSLYDSWSSRLQQEYEAAHPPAVETPAASAAAAGGGLLAGFGGPLLIVGAGLAVALLMGKKGGRRRVH